jgi:hypothetical protein
MCRGAGPSAGPEAQLGLFAIRFVRIAMAVMIVSVLALAARAAAGDCTEVIAGNDTTLWNTSRGTFLGEAVGQTFHASDTLITRITVWRPPNDTFLGAFENRLFVTAVDSTSFHPREPNTWAILQSGPSVLVRDSDPPGLPIRMDFILAPPPALPGRGTYAFFIQREGCDPGETRIIGKEPGNYNQGEIWYTGRTTTLPCALMPAWAWEDVDFCFEIEYCREVTTPTHPKTWGRLKAIYR